MRGKLRIYSFFRSPFRITPADAGKTAFALTYFQIGKDHPRGCGENADTPTVPPKVGGSPPRMRGKPHHRKTPASKDWITPADAGKTVALGGAVVFARDHPRGCGENLDQLRRRIRN